MNEKIEALTAEAWREYALLPHNAITHMMVTRAALQTLAQIVAEECAEIASAVSEKKWHDYKFGNGTPDRANPHVEGMADGADLVYNLIKARYP